MKTRRKIELAIILVALACIPVLWLWCRAANDALVDGLASRGYRSVTCDPDDLPDYFSQPRCFAGPVAVVALGGFHTPGKSPTRFMPTTQYILAIVVPADVAARLPAPADRVAVAGGKVALVWNEGHDWGTVSRRLDSLGPGRM
jgi:hypothetical protein